jgi:hypothetical protein
MSGLGFDRCLIVFAGSWEFLIGSAAKHVPSIGEWSFT